jgi:hypothetical protein
MNPRTRTPRRIAVASLLVTLALPVGGTAYGFWSDLGSGSGSASTSGQLALTLSPGTPAADLYPGGVTDVVVTISNPNDRPLQVSSLALDSGQGTSGFAVDAAHLGCDVSALSFTTDTNGGAGWTVPAEVGAVAGALPVTLTGALKLDEDAANSCQGASATVYLAVGP